MNGVLSVNGYLIGANSGGSGSGGHEIQDEGTAMAQEDALNFIDHDLTDDSTNGATVVKPHRLSSAELSEICSPLPDAPTLVGNVRMSLLWENSDPTQSMSLGTSIATNQSMDNFDLILMVMRMNTSGYYYSAIGVRGSIVVCGLATAGTMVSRQINYVDSTHLSAGAGWSGSTQDASVAIPCRAYGIKLL